MALILVVEDDADIAEMLKLYLCDDGHRVERASDGESALRQYRETVPDLVLLDIGLPKLDGLEVLRRIREQGHTPVILLTARSEEIDELLGLGLGGDGYLTKPCSPRRVLAHVKAVLRRGLHPEAEGVYTIGPLELNTYQVRVTVHSRELSLTPTEYRLLAHLASVRGKAVARAELLGAALPESGAHERTIDVHLKNLRHKFAEAGIEHLLETVRGIGYRLADRSGA